MKLPNADKAFIERGKITEYLLNPAHPDNGGKAAFFAGLGFQREQWEILAGALKRLAGAAEVMAASETPHGTKYVIAGRIEAPIGRDATVQTIWIVDKGQDAARLVTAYPRKV